MCFILSWYLSLHFRSYPITLFGVCLAIQPFFVSLLTASQLCSWSSALVGLLIFLQCFEAALLLNLRVQEDHLLCQDSLANLLTSTPELGIPYFHNEACILDFSHRMSVLMMRSPNQCYLYPWALGESSTPRLKSLHSIFISGYWVWSPGGASEVMLSCAELWLVNGWVCSGIPYHIVVY